tara:strand:+ start:271 stop:558 length:288 start_codon:yes stop_codon:yes gene_type:complete
MNNKQHTPFQNRKINHYALLAVIDDREQDSRHLARLNAELATPFSKEEWQTRCDHFQRTYEVTLALHGPLERGPGTNKDFLKKALNGDWPTTGNG